MTDQESPAYYAVTTIADEACPNGWFRTRTVGIFKTEEEAVDVVKRNGGDLEEAGYYTHAVIEELFFGLYPALTRPSTSSRRWFAYAGHDRWQEMISEPSWIAKWQRHFKIGLFATIG